MKEKDSILLIEPGGLGDVLIVLPIAAYYAKKGHPVTMLVQEKVLPLAPYVSYTKLVNITDRKDFDTVIDLELGSDAKKDATNAWRKENKRHFDQWKYDQADVPFQEKFNLKHALNVPAAASLMALHGLCFRDYIVVCSQDSTGRSNILLDYVDKKHTGDKLFEIYQVPEYNILDWVMVIWNAKYGYFVDSAFANLANGAGLLRGRRSFLPNHGKWGEHTEICTPVLADDWEEMHPQ